jgi:hypothetical protein
VLLLGTFMLRALGDSATVRVARFEFRQAERPMKDVTPPRESRPENQRERPRLAPPRSHDQD